MKYFQLHLKAKNFIAFLQLISFYLKIVLSHISEALATSILDKEADVESKASFAELR